MRLIISRHIVITGASRGIGAALAEHYANKATTLTLISRSQDALQAVGERCRAKGASVQSYVADVADAEAMAAILLNPSHPPIDLLIANAGMGGADAVAGPAGETAEAARAIARTNFLGVINTVAPTLAGFGERGRGQIVIIGSLAGAVPLPSSPVYSGTKAGVRAYAIALDRLIRKSGVRVIHVAPGFVATDMSASLNMQLPYLVSLDDAVKIITRGIDRERREIVFPWQWRVVAVFLSLLPDWLLVRIVGQSQKSLENDRPNSQANLSRPEG